MTSYANNRLSYLEKQRIRLLAARMFEKGVSRSEVGRTLGVSRQAVMIWHRTWKLGGKHALLGPGRAGAKSRLSDDQLADLDVLLRDGPRRNGFDSDLWTLRHIAALIERKFCIILHPNYVRQVLRRRLGWEYRPRFGPISRSRRFTWRPPVPRRKKKSLPVSRQAFPLVPNS